MRRLATTWEAEGVDMLWSDRHAGLVYVRYLEAEYASATVRVHLASCAALYRAPPMDRRHRGASLR